jgi:hypothetical protein
LQLSSADSTAFNSADFEQSYNFLRLRNTTDDRAVGIEFSIGSNGDAAITAVETSDGETSLVFGTRGSGSRSEKVRITHGGLVGIGTSSPNSTLECRTTNPENTQLVLSNNGTFHTGLIGSSTTTPYLDANAWGIFGGPNTYLTGIANSAMLIGGSGVPGIGIRFTDSNLVNSAGQTRLYVTNTGRLGVGTTSPRNTLDVNGSIFVAAGNQIQITGSGGAAGLQLIGQDSDISLIGTMSAQPLVFRTGSNERARIDSSGRLLVGTSSYSGNGKLVTAGHVGGNAGTFDICWAGSRPTAADTDIGYIRWFSADNSSSNAQYAYICASSDGASSSGNDIPGRLVFSTTADGASNPTERMRIGSDGTIYFNVTVAPSGSVGGSAFLAESDSRRTLYMASTTTGATTLQVFRNPNGQVGSITTSGSATAFNTSSDYRLKENVIAVTDGIARLQQLKPIRFNFIADPNKTFDGFFAHEVQTIVPEAISGEKDAVDDDNNPIYQGIDQSKLVPLLTAALQEAVTKIESLEARLTAAGI